MHTGMYVCTVQVLSDTMGAYDVTLRHYDITMSNRTSDLRPVVQQSVQCSDHYCAIN